MDYRDNPPPAAKVVPHCAPIPVPNSKPIDTIAVLTCDGAGWHQPGGALLVPDNIILLHLPPYSPELNPMENVWDYLRQNKLCAVVWDSYDEIVEACKTAWNWLIADPTRIKSIGSREWACVNL
jgi:hypothetical protein